MLLAAMASPWQRGWSGGIALRGAPARRSAPSLCGETAGERGNRLITGKLALRLCREQMRYLCKSC